MTASPSLTVIEPPGWFSGLGLAALWRRREFVDVLVFRDLRGRYRHMALGPLWLILTPFMQMVVFSIVFGGFVGIDSGTGLPYPVFLFAAMLPWMLFSTVLNSATTGMLNYVPMLREIYMPRLVPPTVQVLAGSIDWAASMSIMLGLILIYQLPIPWTVIVLPFYLLATLVVGLSVGLLLAPITVWFRDVARLVGYGLNTLFYLTPVLYPLETVPEAYRSLVAINPAYTIIRGFRFCLTNAGEPPSLADHLITLGPFVPLLFVALLVYERASQSIIDAA